MNTRHLGPRTLALLLTIAALLFSAAAPVGAMTPAGAPGRAAAGSPSARTNAAPLSSYGQPFHFLPPLGVESGDPSKFDPSLLSDLVVTICRLDSAGCTVVKTITSSSALAEQLRIMSAGGIQSFYQANWDTSGFKLTPSTFRIIVTVDGLVLGSVDETAAAYKSFPRTWPIKFRIEKNPVIRVRQLHEAGKGASQIGNAIRLEFGLCGDDLANLLANDLEPFTQKDVDAAVAGVCQAAVIPATTKVADTATGNAMTGFDPDTGVVTFSTTTALLGNLKVGDVLVGEPNGVAPAGYLRKVTSITKSKKTGAVTLQTTQARLDETITQGTLDATGDLNPSDLLSTQTAPGVTFTGARTSRSGASGAAGGFGLADIGDGFDFHEAINVDFEGDAVAGGGVTGNAKVHISGFVNFNAGYNIGFGIQSCVRVPFFTCLDRVEAHLGAHLSSDLHVTGTFNGELHKEQVLATHFFQPIIFFIGPVPVVLIPILKAVAGVDGTAHATFTFDSSLNGDMDAGAKWTDPTDDGHSWEVTPVHPNFPNPDVDAKVQASMDLHAHAGADAELLLYGIGGPGLAAHVGIEGKVQVPGNPVWEIRGEATGKVSFGFDLGGILSLVGFEKSFRDDWHIASSENQAPQCWGQTGVIPVALNHVDNLGPHTLANNWNGWFDCPDPEGGHVTYKVTDGGNEINYSSYQWTSTGQHDVVVTASDPDGHSSQVTLQFDVEDSPPVLSTVEASGVVRAGVQYFVTATAWDAEAGTSGDWLLCDAMQWQATNATIRITSGGRFCTAEVIFSQAGTQTITVTATEPKVGGKSSTHSVTVNVLDAPANPAPILGSFTVTAAEGPLRFCDDPTGECVDQCQTGTNCLVPPDRILFNGMTGDFVPPLTLYVAAHDPNGDPLTVQWFCNGDGLAFPVTDNHNGTYSCMPFSSDPQVPILIWATVGDGTTFVHTEVRRLYMYSRLLVN